MSDDDIKQMMNAIWSKSEQPDVILVDERNHVGYRRELAASNAAAQFEGSDWRRIKREMNKARGRIHYA